MGGAALWGTGVGITLSERQCAYARQSLAADRLSDKVEIRLMDYRDLNEVESYDKIVSVGMYEHVGLRNLPLYFATVAKLLRPGGAFLNHGIVATDPEGAARGPAGGEFIDRYVFPGAPSAPIANHFRSGARRPGVRRRRGLASALRAHAAALDSPPEARRDEAIRAAGARRYRIWLVYLAGMAHAFDRGWLSVAQVLSFKPTADGIVRRPWTRDSKIAESQPASRRRRTARRPAELGPS